MKDNEFYRWNTTNIMANLLQAEDHLCTVVDSIAPEHGACVIKHLTNTIGELLEISKHCYIAAPDKCKDFKQLSNDVYIIKNDFEDNGMDDNSMSKVRGIRKRVEKLISMDTDKCETGFCKFKPDTKEIPNNANVEVEIVGLEKKDAEVKI